METINQTKKINEYIKQIDEFLKTKEQYEDALNKTLKKIKFLESIYITGEVNNVFSKEFNDSAIKERNELCLLSSVLYKKISEVI